MSDEKVFLTADEAVALLPDGDTVHNFVNPGGMLIGCDYDRAEAIETLRGARQIEIGGEACRAMRHPLAVYDGQGRLSFFEADMERIEAFEAAKATSLPSPGQGGAE